MQISKHTLPTILRCVVLFLIVLLSACKVQRNPFPEELLGNAQVTNFEYSPVRVWGNASVDELNPEHYQNTPPLKVVKDRRTGQFRQDFLVLSGGGANGAYGSGLLNGWTQSGTRPEFSVVTGVSTGAIIAPFAYLGSDYDYLIKEFYTTHSTKDLLVVKGVGGLVAGSSVADSKPLAKLIEKYVTPELLKEIAIEYQSGRYLLVGTTNLDAQRPVTWNMGEIAKVGGEKGLALFRKVILASISIPAAFPPVLMDVNFNGVSGDELHVDGGTTDNAILLPVHLEVTQLNTTASKSVKRRVFVVVNSTLEPKAESSKTGTVNIALRSVGTLIKQQTRGDVLLLYNYARANGIDYNYTQIPDGFDVKSNELFDMTYMGALFDLGEQSGLDSQIWQKVPGGY